MKLFLSLRGIDAELISSAIAKSVQIIIGVVTIIFMIAYLTPKMQGYFYSFNSLVGMQVFVELGFNYAIMQITSHEMSKLKWTTENIIDGDINSKKRLKTILIFSLRWYLFSGIIFILIAIPFGLYFLNAYPNLNILVFYDFGLPWILTCILISIGLILNGLMAVLEGAGKIKKISNIRTIQTLAMGFITCIFIYVDYGVYAIPAGILVALIVGFLGVGLQFNRFIKNILHFKSNHAGINWKSEILPFQSKIAISWICGFIVFQLFTLVLFKIEGPDVAGQFGMTMQIIMAVNSLSITVLLSRSPYFGLLISNGNLSGLKNSFKRYWILSTYLLILLLLILNILYLFFQHFNYELLNRILDYNYFALLSVGALLNHIVYCRAIALRSFKDEPFLRMSILSAALTILLVLFLTDKYGLYGCIIASLLSSLFSFFYSFYIFKRKWDFL